jgi:hypothetical protein
MAYRSIKSSAGLPGYSKVGFFIALLITTMLPLKIGIFVYVSCFFQLAFFGEALLSLAVGTILILHYFGHTAWAIAIAFTLLAVSLGKEYERRVSEPN